MRVQSTDSSSGASEGQCQRQLALPHIGHSLNSHRSPWPIPDNSQRVIGACIPYPKGGDWANTNVKASGAIEAARGKCIFPAKTTSEEHRRGPFPALAVGVSYGGGQTVSPASIAK